MHRGLAQAPRLFDIVLSIKFILLLNAKTLTFVTSMSRIMTSFDDFNLSETLLNLASNEGLKLS